MAGGLVLAPVIVKLFQVTEKFTTLDDLPMLLEDLMIALKLA